MVSSDSSWARLIATSGEAAIWLADLDAADAGDRALAVLSVDEHERAGRFVFDTHRRRFIACRAWLRHQLSERLTRAPQHLRFEYGPMGKPSLAGSALRFNVSHSDRYALLAVAGVEIGVDIERERPLSDMDALAERVFSAGERHALAQVPADRRGEAFFAGWTRKEAYIKARGDSLRLLEDFDVALTPEEPVRLKRVAGDAQEPARWTLLSLAPLPGYAAALCIERRAPT